MNFENILTGSYYTIQFLSLHILLLKKDVIQNYTN